MNPSGKEFDQCRSKYRNNLAPLAFRQFSSHSRQLTKSGKVMVFFHKFSCLLLLNLSLGVGSQDDRIVGTTIADLDKTSNEKVSIFELDQPSGAINSRPDK